jgi:molybdopterin molybdotransferase
VTTNSNFEVSWQLAREIAHKAAGKSEAIQVPLSQAGGMVLAHDIHALGDMPPFAASRIDGWAVSGPGPWQRVGDALAGHEFVTKLNSGECVHTATGAVMPEGATAALKDEESRLENAYVYAIESAAGLLDQEGALPHFHDVRPSGYEAKLGEVLIPSGTKLTPAIIGVAAGAGHDALPVFKKIVVDVLIFGDELILAGPSRDGKVRDSLGPQIPFWIDELGAEVKSVTHVADTLADHVAAISKSNADLIITTGGTASGPVDHLHNAIVDVGGEFLVDAVLVRPGYHQLMARIGEQILIGLPGNPQSAVIGLLTLAAPLISGANGRPLTSLDLRTIVSDVSGLNREVRLVLGTQDAGTIRPIEYLDSSMLRGFVSATGYAVLPPGGAKSGDQVQWMPLPWN